MLKRSKYGAIKTGGFPSKLEATVYEILRRKEMAGEISELKRQQTVVLQGGPRETRITWRVDFSFVENKSGLLTYAEAKGFATDVYKLKLKLWRKLRPARLQIWKSGRNNIPIVVETIEADEPCVIEGSTVVA